MRVRVVLVEPQEGGKLGAAARVMKNFGWRDLTIVGPAPDAPDESRSGGRQERTTSPRHPVGRWWTCT